MIVDAEIRTVIQIYEGREKVARILENDLSFDLVHHRCVFTLPLCIYVSS